MAWALVRWTKEDRLSIISSSWILEPSLIVQDSLPVFGVAYWRKKSNKFDIELMHVSGIDIYIYITHISDVKDHM